MNSFSAYCEARPPRLAHFAAAHYEIVTKKLCSVLLAKFSGRIYWNMRRLNTSSSLSSVSQSGPIYCLAYACGLLDIAQFYFFGHPYSCRLYNNTEYLFRTENCQYTQNIFGQVQHSNIAKLRSEKFGAF